jgi:hypothetical protein
MKKLLLISVFLLALLATINVQAQRYYEEVFDNVIVTEGIYYGTNVSILPIILGQSNDPLPEDLYMDVYEPEGDTLSQRPVVIIAHSGDFLPAVINQSPYGTRTDSAVVEMCKRLARRGFVAISMDYRLGWNPFGSDIDIKKTVLEAVYRITQDMRTCVRFVRKHVAEDGNTFGFDPGRIAVGGIDAAGWAAESCAYMKRHDQTLLPKFLDFSTIPPTPFILDQLMGNPYGTDDRPLNIPNHVNYSSDVNVVIDFEGGCGDFTWIEPGDPPVIAFQSFGKFAQNGIHDVTIGVGGSIIIADGAFPDTVVHRSHALGNQAVFVNANLNDPLTQTALQRTGGIEGLLLYHPYTQEGSVQCDPTPGAPATNYGGNTYPWNWYNEEFFAFIWDQIPGQTVPSNIFLCQYNVGSGNPNDPAISRTMIDTLMDYMTPRLILAMDLTLTGTNDGLKKDLNFVTFPNPAGDFLRMKANEPFRAVELFDLSGRLVYQQQKVNHNDLRINTSALAPGLYTARVKFDRGVVTDKFVVK